jgi:hypothetical protein
MGSTLTGAVSAATGIIIAVTNEYFVLSKVTGTFQAENVTVSAMVVGVSTEEQVANGAVTLLLHAQYKALAANLYRNDISAVPGSGPIRGIVNYGGVKYAFRDNASATAVDVYKSSVSGWTAVALGRELSFTSGGTYEPKEGDIITGHTSAATATLTRIVHETGSYSGGDSAGRFIFAAQSGTFVAETLDIGANINVATIAGGSSNITFAVPGGRFEFVVTNFTGSTSTTKVYGCDGKNRGFEFDGTVMAPINTGMTTDTPSHITSHCNQLIFSFSGSVQNSGPGLPYEWSAITGSAEIAMGEEITGFMPLQGDASTSALAIYTRNSIAILYGTGAADWKLVPYKQGAGAIANTIQMLTDVFCLDDRGMTTLAATQKYGNFHNAVISKHVQPWLTERRSAVTASCIMRDKNQYWLFFSDQYALVTTIDNGKIAGIMPVFLSDNVQCIDSRENTSGEEEVFFGADDGFIYQMNKGTSFDGEEIESFMNFAYANFKSPNVIKRFHRATIEVEGNGYSEFLFGYSLEYGSAEVEQPSFSPPEILELSENVWDEEGAIWDRGIWDSVSLSPGYFAMEGNGTNVSAKIRTVSAYCNQIKLSGILIEYIPRRLRR